MRLHQKRVYVLKRMIGIVLAVCAVIPCGCTGSEEPADDGPIHNIAVDISPVPVQHSGERNPLVLMRLKGASDSGCTYEYPYVCNTGMALLNISIKQELMELAEGYDDGCIISYTVLYNHSGLLSLMAEVTRMDKTVVVDSVPLNFDADSGLAVTVADCFGSGGETWRYTLPDLITDGAEAMNYTVISYMPPVNDRQLFYFHSGGIVFYYRMYELCTADAGCPSIGFSAYQLREFINSDGLLMRFL